MPWHRIVLTGDDQHAYSGRRQRLSTTIAELRLRHAANTAIVNRIALLARGNNEYLVSPEASELLPDLLDDYEAAVTDAPQAGTVILMVGDQDKTEQELGLKRMAKKKRVHRKPKA